MWVIDAHSQHFLDVNPAATRLYGYSRAEFLVRCLSDLIVDDGAANLKKKTASKKPARKNASVEAKHSHKDGSILSVSVVSQPVDYDGRPAELLVIKQTVTPQAASDSSDEALDYANRIITASPVGIITCKASGEIVSCNKAAANMIGGIPSHIARQNFRKLKSWKESGLLQAADAALAELREHSLEARGTSTFGKKFWFFAQFIPFEYAGQPHLLVLLTDITDQRQVEQALHQIEDRYRDLVDNSQVLMCTHDLQGNLLSINPWAIRALGYEREEQLIGRSIEDALVPETRPLFRRYLRNIARDGSGTGIMQVQTTSGQRRLWEFHNTLRAEDVAEPIVRGTAFDVTERREAEQALRESEASYKLLFEAAPIGIGLTDMAGHLLAFNDAIMQPGGYERADILAMESVASLYDDPLQRDHVLSLFRSQGYVTQYEVRFKRKDGSAYDALLTLTKIELQGKPRLQALVEDITERRAAGQALRKSEALYRELFNNALEGIFRTAPDGRFLSANPALVHMLGYNSEDELLSLSVSSLYIDPQAHEAHLQQIRRDGEMRDFEVSLRRRGGGRIIALANMRVLRDAQGQAALYEGTLTDITERKQIEDALRSSEGELQALFQAIPDLVLVLDKDGRYLKIAPGHEEMLVDGAPPGELLGKTLHEVFSKQKADEFVSYIEKALQTRKPVRFEYALLIGPDIRWFSGSVAPLAGNTVVWVARDITQHKRIEQQVQDRLLELEALYESGLALGQTLDPKQIGKEIIDVLANRLNWHHATVRVRRENTEELELLAFSETAGTADITPDGQALASNAITRVGQGMAGWVIQHGRILNSGNLPEDPRYYPTFPNMLSGLYVPIWTGGRVLGCITVETHQPDAFTERDELLLTTLASQAAAALENARLFAVTQQRGSESLALYELTRDLTAQSDLASLLNTVAARAASLLKVPGGGVYLYDPYRQDLEIATATDGSLPIGTRLSMGDGMAGRVAQTREPLAVDDYPTWQGRLPQFADRSWAAVVEAPMLYRGELIGVLAAYRLHSDDPSVQDRDQKFTEQDTRLLSLFAVSAAGAIYSARLFDAERLRREEAENLRAGAVRSADRLSTLHAATREIAHISQDLEQVYSSIHQAASRLLPTDAFTIVLVDEARELLHGVYLFDRTGRTPSMDIPFGDGFSSRVIQTGETLLIKDLETAQVGAAYFGSTHDEHSILAVPLRVGGQVIGALSVQNCERDVYRPEDQVLLEMLAAQAAIGIQNARLYQGALRSAERQAILHRVSQSLTRISQDPQHLYAAIHAAAAQLMTADVFSIALLREDEHEMEGVYAVDRGKRWPVIRFPAGAGYSGWVLEHMETLWLPDTRLSQIKRRVPFPGAGDTRSVLMVPLRVADKALGVISVQSYQAGEYNAEDRTLLEMLASQAAIAIQNARLFQETQARAEEFKALYESASALPLQSDTALLLDLVVERATQLLHASRGSVYLYDSEHDVLTPAARHGMDIGFEPRLKLGEGAAGHVALTREPIVIDDYQTWEGRSSQYQGVPFRAVLEVPMLYGGELIGVLSVNEFGENSTRKFTQADARLLSLYATQAAGALYNARLLDDTRRRLHEFESLAKVGEALTGTLELEPLLENILRTAIGAIPAAEKGTILLRSDGEQGHLHMRAQVGYSDPHLEEIPFDDSKGYAGQSFHEVRPLLVRDSIAEYEIPFGREFPEVNQVQSAIVAPLIVKGEAIGAISLDNALLSNAFDEADLRLLVLFASSAAVVIENARLFGETRRRAQEFEVLYEATRDLSANRQDLSALLSTLVEKAVRLMGSHSAGMYLYDAVRGDLEVAVVSTGGPGVGERVKLGEGAAGRVAQTRSPLVVDDYRVWEGRRSMHEGSPLRALLHVPMIYGGDLIGVLEAFEYGDSERKFSEADVKLLTLFAWQAAVAVHSARLFEETRKKAAQFASLYETARDLSDQRNVTQLLETIVERAGRLLNAPVSGIYLYDKARNDLYVAVNRGFTSSLGVRLAMGEAVAGRVAQTRQPMIIDDYQLWQGRSQHYEEVPLRSVLEVPMLYSGELIGVLTVDEYGESERKFTQDDADLLSLFASYAASAVHTARLFEQISRRAGEFEALYQTAADISSQTDLQTLLDTVIQRTRDLMNAAGSDVYLFDANAHDLELAAANDPDHQRGTRLQIGEGVSGRVAETKQPLIVSDYQHWEGRSERYEGLPYTSAIGIPMLYGGQLIGVLTAYNRTGNHVGDAAHIFTAQDQNLLELLANAAAGAVYVARLLDQTRRRVAQLSALHAVDTAIGSTTDMRVSLQAVLESAIHELGVDAADVLLLNQSTLTLQYTAGNGFFTSEINRTSASIGTGRAGKAALDRQMVHVPDLTAASSGFLRMNLVAAERFKAYVAVPLIAKGEVKGVLEVFQRSPFEFDEERKSLLEVLAGQAALAIDNARLFEGLEKANLELTMAYDATIEGWSQALEMRDQETQGHSSRVVDLTLRLAASMGFPDRQLRDLRRGVLLHDIGKMGIPDAILHKPGPLTPEEWQVMRQHPQYAYDLLSPIIYLRNALDIPYGHHEKWDGTGYPRGLKAETIPLSARLFAVVDVYDALTSNRPYRAAWSKQKTVEYIVEQSGKHFDPRVVNAFLKLLGG